MAANYWVSSQYLKWTFKDISTCPGPSQDLMKVSKEDYSLLHAYFANILTKIGKNLNIRQKHIATAIMFFKRFYIKNSFYNTEPFLVAITSMYLAGKIDEYPYHITNVLQESLAVLKDSEPTIKVPYTQADLADFECYLIQELDCNITPHHPYHPFSIYMKSVPIDGSTLQLAWYIINDMYMTDLVMTHQPHKLALASILMIIPSSTNTNYANHNQTEANQAKLKSWFIDLNVDMEELAIIVQKMLNFYHLYRMRFNNALALVILKALHEFHHETMMNNNLMTVQQLGGMYLPNFNHG